MARTMPESRLQAKIKKALHQNFPGSVFYKMHGSEFMESGIPDLIGVVGGHFIALEVKHPDTSHGVTPIQQAQLNRLREAGATTAVVESVDEALNVVMDAVGITHHD